MKSLVTALARFTLVGLVKFYRACVSPLLPASCIYSPTALSICWRRWLNTAPLRGAGWA